MVASAASGANFLDQGSLLFGDGCLLFSFCSKEVSFSREEVSKTRSGRRNDIHRFSITLEDLYGEVH